MVVATHEGRLFALGRQLEAGKPADRAKAHRPKHDRDALAAVSGLRPSFFIIDDEEGLEIIYPPVGREVADYFAEMVRQKVIASFGIPQPEQWEPRAGNYSSARLDAQTFRRAMRDYFTE